MNTFTFTTKETYLAWRADWKAEYAATSETIRATKKAINQQHREQGYAKSADWRTLFSSVRKANELLGTLISAKEEAGRQYHAAKEKQNA